MCKTKHEKTHFGSYQGTEYCVLILEKRKWVNEYTLATNEESDDTLHPRSATDGG